MVPNESWEADGLRLHHDIIPAEAQASPVILPPQAPVIGSAITNADANAYLAELLGGGQLPSAARGE